MYSTHAANVTSAPVRIAVLGAHGVTQGQISGLTGIPQGRLSEYMTRKRVPRASSTFQAFAGGVGMPAAARGALGLAPDSAGQSAAIGRQLPDGAVPAVGLSYPDTPADATDNLAQLWQADLSDSAAPWGQADPGAWTEVSLRWLVDPGRQPGSGAAGAVRIGMADIERFRATVDLFVQLDNRFGGGHARAALVQYLSIDAERLLRGRYSETTGRALYLVGGRGDPSRRLDELRQHALQRARSAVLRSGTRARASRR